MSYAEDFTKLDKDKDGKITGTQWAGYIGSLWKTFGHLSVKQITAVFDSVDSDKDDKITVEQFAEAIEKLKGIW